VVRDLGPQPPAASIGADELAAWFDRTRDSYAPATWNRDRVIVRSFVRALQAQGATRELPPIGYRRLRPVRTRALTRAEVARILCLPVALREKTLWTLAYDSAARASELLGLDVGELDLANRRAVVTSKGGAREWVTWSTSTARLCRACSRAATRVRCSPPAPVAGGGGQARPGPRRHGAAELPAGRGAVQGRDRVHAASASALRADAPGGGRRLGADADDQESAPVDREPGAIRTPIDRALQRFEAARDPARRG
jgi:integrase